MCRSVQALLFSSMVLIGFIHAQAQTVNIVVRSGSGSIAGIVTVGGKPRGNVPVSITEINHGNRRDRTGSDGKIRPLLALNTTTNADGQYRFHNLPAGSYQINLRSKIFTITNPEAIVGKLIAVDDGETKEDVNLDLIRGGVITGRVTDADGKPLITAQITIRVRYHHPDMPGIDLYFQEWYSPYKEMLQTDDRGIYRIYGLPKGQYVVGAGGDASLYNSNPVAHDYPRTWHPGVTDQKQARILEIDDGSEITGVDIQFGDFQKTYWAFGRVVDAENGAGIAGAHLYCFKSAIKQYDDHRNAISWTDAQGRFRLGGLTNGTYELRAQTVNENNQFYVEKTTFVIADGNVEGVNLKAYRGGSISGAVVFQDIVDKRLRERLRFLSLDAEVILKSATGESTQSLQVKPEPNGKFQITGLRPGRVIFRSTNSAIHPLRLLRTEQNGADVSDGIEVVGGQKIEDVRIVFAEGKGVIQGQLLFTGQTLPENAEISVRATPVEGNNRTHDRYSDRAGYARADDKRRFVIEGLLPGEYEIRVLISLRLTPIGSRGLYDSVKPEQRVRIGSDAEAHVTINIDLSKVNLERQ